MPAPNDGQSVASTWEHVVGDKPEDNIHDDYWLTYKLRDGRAFLGLNGGRTINPLLEYTLNTTVTSISDTEPISTSRIDVFDQAEFDWKEYGGTVVMSEIETAKNMGESAKFKLLPAKLQNLKMSMESAINEGCFSLGTGNSGKDIGGLQHIVSVTPSSGIVGGIDRGSFTFWRNIQVTGTKSSTAFDNLRASMRSAYNQASNGYSGDHPDFGVTTRTVMEGYEALLVANERFTDKGSGDGGFKNEALKFKAMMFSYDNDCLAGAFYMLNTKYLKLAYLKGRWFKGFEAVEPANQFIEVFKVYTACNLVTTNPRRLAVISAIN